MFCHLFQPQIPNLEIESKPPFLMFKPGKKTLNQCCAVLRLWDEPQVQVWENFMGLILVRLGFKNKTKWDPVPDPVSKCVDQF